MSFNADSLLLRFRQYFAYDEIDKRPSLVLFKYPYISNYINIRLDCDLNYNSIKIVPLKEFFVLCFSYKNNINQYFTFQILDFDLNIINIKNIIFQL